MRIYISLTSNKEIVPFTYQTKLTGILHRLIGENNIHDSISLYSFSNLIGGKQVKNGLDFNNGAKWFVSAYDEALIKTMVDGIRNNNEFCYGMKITEVIIQNNPDFSGIEYFKVASPIFVKRKINERENHYTYKDDGVDNLLTETLKTKMKNIGLVDGSLEIAFDRNYLKAQTKLIQYNDVRNRVNWCPVIIKGKNETKQFAWNVGVGNSTGIGFGSIY